MASHLSKLDVTNDKHVSSHQPVPAEPTSIFDLKPTIPTAKPKEGQQYLDVPLQDSFRSSLDTLSNGSTYSADNENERNTGRSLSPHLQRIASRSPAPPKTWRGKWEVFWLRNKGLALVLIAQLFGGLMNVATRLLETDDDHGEALSPFQILFARMSITAALCYGYMWWAKIKHAPMGMKEVRWLLVARGLTGFFGVFGIYYSLIYLPIAEATVITFLAPLIACWACSVLVHEPFTRMEQIAGLVSLVGVVMIAQPASFFTTPSTQPSAIPIESIPGAAPNSTSPTASPVLISNDATPTQRLMAVGVGLIGTCGAAGAYTTIRWIGQRAHPLISVNYFATWCTIVSIIAPLTIPGITFHLPSTVRQWTLLIFLGVCGFVMQFLLTAGLAHEKSSRATQMVYTQMLFALAFDKLFWGSVPGWWSIVGSSLILGSAVYVAVKTESGGKGTSQGPRGRADEEVGLMGGGGEGMLREGDEEDEEDEDEEGRGPLRGVQEVQLRTMRH